MLTAVAPKQKAPAKPRGKTKGFWAKGVWVHAHEAEAQAKAEPASRSEDKAASTALQLLGMRIPELSALAIKQLLQAGHLNERVLDAVQEHAKLKSFEAKRRQAQRVGKLMRTLGDEASAAIAKAVDEQARGAGVQSLIAQQALNWRAALLARDEALAEWVTHLQSLRPMEGDAPVPAADTQQLRAWIRQARKDALLPADDKPKRAARELLDALKTALTPP